MYTQPKQGSLDQLSQLFHICSRSHTQHSRLPDAGRSDQLAQEMGETCPRNDRTWGNLAGVDTGVTCPRDFLRNGPAEQGRYYGLSTVDVLAQAGSIQVETCPLSDLVTW